MALCTVCRSPVTRRRRYCSDTCRLRAHNQRRRVRARRLLKCLACRTRFRPVRKGQTYCSSACRQAEYRARLQETLALLVNGGAVAAYLREDLRRANAASSGRTTKPSPRNARLDAVGRLLDKIHRDRELRKAGIDPRPARRNGKAIRRTVA